MPSPQPAVPAVTRVRLPVPGCSYRLLYDHKREVSLWLLSLPGRVLVALVFLSLDLWTYFAWARVTRTLAAEMLAWTWANVCDWLRPPPRAAQLERALREHYLNFILAPEWGIGDLLERGMLLLGSLLDTLAPPAGIALYPITDGWLGSVIAGDRREALRSETRLCTAWVEALAAGELCVAPAPRPAVWLPVRHGERLLACIEVRDPGVVFRARAQDVRNLLATLARALAHAPLTGSDDDPQPRA